MTKGGNQYIRKRGSSKEFIGGLTLTFFPVPFRVGLKRRHMAERVKMSFFGLDDSVFDVAVDPDNKIVAGGGVVIVSCDVDRNRDAGVARNSENGLFKPPNLLVRKYCVSGGIEIS